MQDGAGRSRTFSGSSGMGGCLAEKITGPLEEALTVGFSQVLTIAATEPVSLLHSKPPKLPQARGRISCGP
ncbi:snRNA-activating protein complex subunit 2 [Manis javanica]|nr:snRNA-activating protein complex subunit 2 [Manis javanica]